MNRTRTILTLGLFVIAGLLPSGPLRAEHNDGERFEVTVTNLTRGQQFTPILVASHRAGVKLFTLGHQASPQLETLAEEGDVRPMTALLQADPKVLEVTHSAGLTNPGSSVTLTVRAGDEVEHLSVAAMLIPTNDGFFALNDVPGPRGSETVTLYSPAYDAGTEVNDELCSSIPGPFFVECGGPGGGADIIGGNEGFVHIHEGIHGVGDLKPNLRDWRNPVAQITIRRIFGD